MSGNEGTGMFWFGGWGGVMIFVLVERDERSNPSFYLHARTGRKLLRRYRASVQIAGAVPDLDNALSLGYQATVRAHRKSRGLRQGHDEKPDVSLLITHISRSRSHPARMGICSMLRTTVMNIHEYLNLAMT